jgi:hypothetical protein
MARAVTDAIVRMVVRRVNPYTAIQQWNKVTERYRTSQTKQLMEASTFRQRTPFGGAPSLCLAQDCPIDYVQALHREIASNHAKIVTEVKHARDHLGYGRISYVELDSVQGAGFPGQTGWKPIWIQVGMRQCASVAQDLPLLSAIVSKYSEHISLFMLSVMEPGTELRPHCGPNGGVLRYHYGVQIPAGNTHLLIHTHLYKWQEGEGIIWDDLEMHAAWNHTDQDRIVIFADLLRPFPWWLHWANRMVIHCLERTKHIQDIQKRLDAQGIHMDG